MKKTFRTTFRPLLPKGRKDRMARCLLAAFAPLLSVVIAAGSAVATVTAVDQIGGATIWEMPRWSPYAAGLGIGVLSWFAFLLSDNPLGASGTYAKIT